MAEVQSSLNKVLLLLQLLLALWQLVKLTPVGAFIQGVMGWLLRPLGLSPAYALLQRYGGRVFKSVDCLTTTEHLPGWAGEDFKVADEHLVTYMGDEYNLRKDGEKLFVNGEMSYYISPKIWATIASGMGIGATDDIYIKGYKEIWEGVATGAVMSFSEVLDSFILDNMFFNLSNSNVLLPVNLSVSEEKLLKFLNLLGLFLQAMDLHWFIPLSFSFTSAVLEFSTPVRVWLYAKIDVLFCSAMHLICDKKHYSMRREVYSLGKWVENLKPSNDIQFRIVRGDICVPVAGGAKANREDASLAPYCYKANEEEPRPQRFNCGSFDIICSFVSLNGVGKGLVGDDRERAVCRVQVECNRDEYMKLCTLVSCMAKNRSGLLKSYEPKNKVRVYGLRDSVIHYAKSGFPLVYEMELEDVVVT